MLLPATHDVLRAFELQVDSMGGQLVDAYDGGSVLFLRATLATCKEVRVGDVVQSGVALRTCGGDLLVHPYVFRKVCSNGAIWAHATDTRRIERVAFESPCYEIDAVIEQLEAAVAACGHPAPFDRAVREMKDATHRNGTLDMLLTMSVHSKAMMRSLLEATHRFELEGDRSQYGLMNAVTSVARDTKDPETRWRLEELGGAVPSWSANALRDRDPDAAARSLKEQATEGAMSRNLCAVR